jgi:hypothetical protein
MRNSKPLIIVTFDEMLWRVRQTRRRGAAMRHYMQTLRERGEILDVDREVDPKHELAAVTQAAMRRWNKPILFHRVAGTTLPVLTNLYGSRERLADIIGIAPDDFCRQWTNLTGLGWAAEARGTGGAGPYRMPAQRPAAVDLQRARRRALFHIRDVCRQGA